MKTSPKQSEKTSQEEDKYPSYEEVIQKLPAKYLGGLQNSSARMRKTKYGVYIEIQVTNKDAWESARAKKDFDKAFYDLMLPWALKHPSLSKYWFRGFLFSVYPTSLFSTGEEGAARTNEIYKTLASMGVEIQHVVDSHRHP